MNILPIQRGNTQRCDKPPYLQNIIDDNLEYKPTVFNTGLMLSLTIAPYTPILLGILTLVCAQDNLVYRGVLKFCSGLGAGLLLLLISHGFNRLQRRFLP